jgi:hypothetical protein
MPEHVAQTFEVVIVMALNVAIAMLGWALTRKYTGPGPGADLLPREEAQAAGASAGGYLK